MTMHDANPVSSDLERPDPVDELDELQALLDDSLHERPSDDALLLGLPTDMPRSLEELELRLAEARAELAVVAQAVLDATARYVPTQWERAVEEVIVADPARTIAAAAALPDLKIELLQLRAQAPALVGLTIAPLLPDPADDAALAGFGRLLSGRKPAKIVETPLRILLGAVASKLHRAGLITAGGKHSFTVDGNVWRYLFGIDLGELGDVFAAYDRQIQRIQQLFAQRVELSKPVAKAEALALWQQAGTYTG
jgi:hypothetical protein